ncbi:MAG: (2Fe-2S)-binding protein [Myxococcota bacterium]|nr:(2Fe-2S)-binding protein [Myxococcota bacterium]
MPLIVFESVEDGPCVETDAAEGGRLIDLCDARGAPVPFSCRSASCGTCRVDVLDGGEWLESPGEDELDVLGEFGDDPAHRRLACQARVRPGAGLLRLRAAGD